MKTKKKNRFLVFCFSFIPGAGEMFMGFMKAGISIMSLFALTMALAIGLEQGVLSIISTVIWFYGFFHANHLASLADSDFDAVPDQFLFGMESIPGTKGFVQKYNKWIAYLLIFTGICFLWNIMTNLLDSLLPVGFDFIIHALRHIGNLCPSIVIAIAIIIIGIKLLSGKEVKLAQDQDAIETNKDETNSNQKEV